VSIRFYDNRQDWCYKYHWHEPYEMILVLENTYDVSVNKDKLTLYPNDLLIIPSGTLHEINAPESGHRYFFMVDREKLIQIDGIRDNEHAFYPYVLIRSGTADDIVRHFLAAQQQYTRYDPISHTAVQLELALMLTQLLRDHLLKPQHASEVFGTKIDRYQPLMLDICTYIAQNCAEDLNSRQIAEMIGYSQNYFERLFTSYAGQSFHDYLIEQRLYLSKRLLRQSDDSIIEIAHRAGFRSLATFNRLFKMKEAMSPSQYRKSV